ncbi:hypothetical protein CLCR_07768 [Cladophialophora carrionii]|uniref:Uncharacterized protein n=1 Tax=Cladophialophora carrionii TaxID=86049 RepID=A0A1C1CP02_9EURO|nr:hypothetical protein CLCR_07768 [Cladophialophora carrionii]
MSSPTSAQAPASRCDPDPTRQEVAKAGRLVEFVKSKHTASRSPSLCVSPWFATADTEGENGHGILFREAMVRRSSELKSEMDSLASISPSVPGDYIIVRGDVVRPLGKEKISVILWYCV